jgi:pilus assembly protein Flp/PilA
MTKALNVIKRFAADEEGTALMEYTILLGILVVAVIAIISTLGTWIQTQWSTLCTAITNGGGSC